MDRAVLDAYGWTDIPTECEFLREHEEDDKEGASRRKRRYRYRWPDPVRDEVLARLMELNAERRRGGAACGGRGGTTAVTFTQRAELGGFGSAGNASAPDLHRGTYPVTSESNSGTPETSEQVREALVDALHLDLIGPGPHE